MSNNIRTLNDYGINVQSNNASQGRSQNYMVGSFDGIEQPAQQQNNPQIKDQKCKWFRNCCTLFFPSFRIKSVTFPFLIVILVVYIIDEIVYGSKKPDMSWSCVLYKSGAKFTYAITRQGHLHRLFMPIILHSGVFHIFWNILSFLFIGFAIEQAISCWYKYLILLIVGGICGNIFSSTISPYALGVGSSTSLFAVLACLCIWYFLNFKNLGPYRFQYVLFFGLMLFFALFNGFMFQNTTIDNWGHLGGFIFGLPLGLLFLKPQNDEQKTRLLRLKKPVIIVFSVVLVVFVIAMFARPLPDCEVYNCANICQ